MFWGIWDAEKENLVLPAGKKKDTLTLAFHPKAQVKKMYAGRSSGLFLCTFPDPVGSSGSCCKRSTN
jgi:hypothetical protein